MAAPPGMPDGPRGKSSSRSGVGTNEDSWRPSKLSHRVTKDEQM